MRFTTASNMAEVDRDTIQDHEITETALMETAGSLSARHARNHFLSHRNADRVVVLCGKGHNGADGLVVARWLNQWNYDVDVILSTALDQCSELTEQQAVSIKNQPSIHLHEYDSATDIPDADLYVDALLGTGLSGNPRPPIDEMIHEINNRARPIVSIDIPSGLGGDHNVPFDPSIQADLTVTFGLPKLGMLLEPGYTTTGKIIVQELGFPAQVYEEHAGQFHLITPQDIAPYRPRRHYTDHKGNSGRLSVLAGSQQYPGAAFLASRAASVSGAGLTSVIGPSELSKQQGPGEREIIFPHERDDLLGDVDQAEVRSFIDRQDAFAIGPGLGTSETLQEKLQELLEIITCPTVIDADGLNNFMEEPELLAECDRAILTPHLGEAARLLDQTVESVMKEPVSTAEKLHEITGHTIVLKSSRPLIYHQNGAVSVNVSGSPALAKGGSGDVLTGMIAGFLAQGLDESSAACLGTYLHGAAGCHAESASSTVSVRPESIIDSIPKAYEELADGTTPEWYPIDFESNSPSVLRWNPLP